jgi:excisionase family DNA binding protein
MDSLESQISCSGEELLTLDQTCKLLNLKMSKVRSMVFKNEIPVIRMGRCLRFSNKDLIIWLNERKQYSLGN